MKPASLAWLAEKICLLRAGARQVLFYVEKQKDGGLCLLQDGHRIVFRPQAARQAAAAGGQRSKIVLVSPMPGLILAMHARAGLRVAKGDTLLIMEAMKMQNPIKAPAGGKILRVLASPGMSVESGATLLELET